MTCDSVTPYVLLENDDKNKTTVLPLTFYSMTSDKKRQYYPLCFTWQRPIKSDSITPYVLFDNDDKKKTTVLPLTFYSTTSARKCKCYPLCFIWQRSIKNDSGTPNVLYLTTTNEKQQCYPLCCLTTVVQWLQRWAKVSEFLSSSPTVVT